MPTAEASALLWDDFDHLGPVRAVAEKVVAIAILYDRNEIFPKWFAYVSIWQIITEVIATQMFVFPSGPFAWNGSIAFWWAVVVFSVWLGALIVLLRQAAARESADEPALS